MKIFSVLFILFSFNLASANLLVLDPSGLHPQAVERINRFIQDTEKIIPDSIKQRLSESPIKVRFEIIDKDNKVVLPNCSNVVDSMVEGKGAISQYKAVQKRKTSIRYNQQLHSYTSKNEIVVNYALVDPILRGKSVAQTYDCDHKNVYTLAQASVINGVAHFFNNSFESRRRDRQTLKLSENPQYRFIAGWNNKKLMYAFWPRAVQPYEYAGDTGDHFAYNLEFFLLDPEYACRRPLLHNYISGTLKADPLANVRNCKVNTELLIPKSHADTDTDPETGIAVPVTRTHLISYDLNPDHVYNVYYMRASMGGGIGGFGHSMFRIVVCPPNMSVSASCDKLIDHDLVINPRANVNQMMLDGARGFFGGYPSQFLASSLYDLMDEYGDNELRHLFNMPLGYTDEQGRFVDVMPEDQKRRFIYASLESYWAYYGNYKFVSNNCADEAMRLYQMSSTDPEVLALGVLKPSDINKRLSRLGYIDESEVRQYEKTPGLIGKIFGVGKIRNQKQYDERRAAIEAGRYESALISRVFLIEDAVREIMAMEGSPNPDFKVAKKEIKRWLDLATPDFKWEGEEVPEDLNQITPEQRTEVLEGTFSEIRARYDRLMAQAKTPPEQRKVVLHFYRVMFHVYNKRAAEVGTKAVQLAYAIAYPNKDRKVKEMPKDINVSKEQWQKIRNATDKYSEIHNKLMPFAESSVKRGYGIPLKSDVLRGDEYIALKNAQNDAVQTVVESLTGLLGPEHILLAAIGEFHDELFQLRGDFAGQAAK